MLPNLIIIGAQKCGTTSLHHYLSFHPEIVMSCQKELNFFNESLGWKKGRAWYESYFVGTAKVYGESSPNYTRYPAEKGVPERMYSLIPQAKLIYLVRDPLERLISAYLDYVKGGHEHRTIQEALGDCAGDNFYIYPSNYYMQLEQYLRFYPPSNILILSAEELKERRLETLKKVFNFLGVDATFTCEGFHELMNVSDEKGYQKKKPYKLIRYILADNEYRDFFPTLLQSIVPAFVKNYLRGRFYNATTSQYPPVARPVIDERLKARLIQVFKDDVDKLRRFSGNSFSEWCL